MTADQLVISERRAGPADPAELVATIRSSLTLVAPHGDELGRHFYAELFGRSPETRELFPVHIELQRSRMLRALLQVVQMVDRPDELVPFLEQLGRDHRKFGVLAAHYEVVGEALLAAVGAFAGSAWTPEVEKAWSEAYKIVAAAMRSAAEAEKGPATWLGRVVEHRRLGWDLAVIAVQPSQPIPYRAGQYVSVEMPQRPRLWRYLSPANAPRPDGLLEFHVRAVTNGWVSRAMVAHSRLGDTWRFGAPMGRLHVHRGSGRDVLMVAGGTGLTPLRAILEDLARGRDQPHVQLFFGGRTWDDLYYLATLRRMSWENPWLDVIPVVERDDAGAGGAELGTLADVVTRYGAWAEHDVLVCGSPAMIRATVARMLVAGTPLDRVAYDPFTRD